MSALTLCALAGAAQAVVRLCCINTYSQSCCTFVGGPSSETGCGLGGHSCTGTITTNPIIVRANLAQANGGVATTVVGPPPTSCIGVSRTCKLIGCDSTPYTAGCPVDEACVGNDCKQPKPSPNPQTPTSEVPSPISTDPTLGESR
jgi:hypothetical protein